MSLLQSPQTTRMEYFAHACAAVGTVTVGWWLAQNRGPSAADRVDPAIKAAAQSPRYSQRYGTLDSYGQTSIAGDEVAKLIQSPEFQVWQRANRDRIGQLQTEARGRGRFYFCLLMLLAWYAAAMLPVGTGAGAKSLLAQAAVKDSFVKLLGETPMNSVFASAAAWQLAVPVALTLGFFVSMPVPTLRGHTLTVFSLAVLLWWSGALFGGVGWGLGMLLAVVSVKVFL